MPVWVVDVAFFVFPLLEKEVVSFPCRLRSLTLPHQQARSVYLISELKKIQQSYTVNCFFQEVLQSRIEFELVDEGA